VGPNQAADYLESLAKAAASLDLAPPMQGEARTPDVVDAVWWLALPRRQACLELGISDEMYPIVHRGVEKVVTLYENRRAQGALKPGEGHPLIKRKRTKRTGGLHRGGKIIRVKL
jgi:hypothetical protein